MSDSNNAADAACRAHTTSPAERRQQIRDRLLREFDGDYQKAFGAACYLIEREEWEHAQTRRKLRETEESLRTVTKSRDHYIGLLSQCRDHYTGLVDGIQERNSAET